MHIIFLKKVPERQNKLPLLSLYVRAKIIVITVLSLTAPLGNNKYYNSQSRVLQAKFCYLRPQK